MKSGRDEAQAYVGALLNRQWRLVRVVGQGGLGMVFEAKAEEGDEVVAVKILREEFREDPAIVARFLDEAKTGAKVAHENIAEVREAARAEDGTPYLVMELLTGRPLSVRMNEGPVPDVEAASIARSMLAALAAAHAVGVLHRDLKPDNVFLEATGTGERVKILDFGLARVLDAAGGIERKTRTGMMLGTPGYMSPEQIKDSKSADARADLWSVGVVVYEMLTGRRAFEAENEFARVTKVMTEDPRPIESAMPHYGHWSAFFRRALARDPAARFASADAMLAALPAPGSGEFASAPSVASARGGPTPAGVAPPSGPPTGPFTEIDTAISDAPSSPASSSPTPNVEVVELERPSLWSRPWFVIVVTIVALAVGLALGLTWGGR